MAMHEAYKAIAKDRVLDDAQLPVSVLTLQSMNRRMSDK